MRLVLSATETKHHDFLESLGFFNLIVVSNFERLAKGEISADVLYSITTVKCRGLTIYELL